jgi:hypothetical protein
MLSFCHAVLGLLIVVYAYLSATLPWFFIPNRTRTPQRHLHRFCNCFSGCAVGAAMCIALTHGSNAGMDCRMACFSPLHSHIDCLWFVENIDFITAFDTFVVA